MGAPWSPRNLPSRAAAGGNSTRKVDAVPTNHGLDNRKPPGLQSPDPYYRSDRSGAVVLRLTRPAKILKSTVVVKDANGTELGRVVQANMVGKIKSGWDPKTQRMGLGTPSLSDSASHRHD